MFFSFAGGSSCRKKQDSFNSSGWPNGLSDADRRALLPPGVPQGNKLKKRFEDKKKG